MQVLKREFSHICQNDHDDEWDECVTKNIEFLINLKLFLIY